MDAKENWQEQGQVCKWRPSSEGPAVLCGEPWKGSEQETLIAEPFRKLALAEVWSLQWGSGLEAECGKGAVMLSVRGDELLN